MKLSTRLILTLLPTLATTALADEPFGASGRQLSLTNALQQIDTPTLPEIEIRPPETSDSAPPTDAVSPPSAGANTDPPASAGLDPATPSDPLTDIPAADSSNAGQTSNSDSDSPNATTPDAPWSDSFESLSEQTFGGTMSNPTGLNSVLRTESNLFDSPRLGTIIDQEELDRRHASTVYRALQNEVGVMLQQTGNGQVSPFIRGLTGQQILVLIDGIRMNTSVLRPGPNQYTATIDPGSLSRIEVIRGAESALWGSDAIGGVINFVTRSADPLRGDYASPQFTQYYSTAEASSYTRTGFSGWYGATGVSGGISYLDVGNLDRGGDLGRQPGTDYKQYAGDVKLQRMLTDDHLLTFAMQHFEQNDLKRSDRFLPFVLGPASNGDVPTQRPTVFDPQQRDLIYGRLEGLLPDDAYLANAYSVTLSGMRTKEASIVDHYADNDPDSVPTRREIGEFDDWGWGTTMSLIKDLDDYGKLTYGTDYYDESIDAQRVRIDDPTQAGAAPVPDDPQYPDDSQADRVGVYGSWNVDVTQRLNATTSVRYENINISASPEFDTLGKQYFQRTYQDWVASLGLSYKLSREWRLVGGYYEGFRAPTIDDLTANKTFLQNDQSTPLIGNLDVEPEHSKTYEVGLKFNYDRLRLQVTEFWTDFDSFIDREVIDGQRFLTNQEAKINGTELAGEYLLDRNIALYGNFFYTYGNNTTRDDPLSRIPPMQGTLGLRFTEPSLGGYVDVYTWMVDRADRYAESNLGDVRFIAGGTPGYATLNVRTGRSFGDARQHRVSVAIENITDKYYRVLGSGVDGPGFNAVFGYQYEM
ncbi:TonB-dependent receptor [Allorhodopirellula solitaria]|uniref:Heme/hemopexin utilization protein C n=1 Tax=Allorhodopirellula solitaria TaxID=2527987 RepID=A0A5C5X047_9BACT|nr:TonB-dependent receptor [Allorhodopirellula solitaria]TWT56180.1 Heme/hemopexin utilization protein C precursor [Allorhodopirellula solitaria]